MRWQQRWRRLKKNILSDDVMTRRILAAAAFLAVFFVHEASGQSPVCGEHAVIKNIIERQGESLHYRGVSQSGTHLLEMFLDNREGSAKGFTVVVSQAIPNASTQTCVVFSGYYWENVEGDTPLRTPKGDPS